MWNLYRCNCWLITEVKYRMLYVSVSGTFSADWTVGFRIWYGTFVALRAKLHVPPGLRVKLGSPRETWRITQPRWHLTCASFRVTQHIALVSGWQFMCPWSFNVHIPSGRLMKLYVTLGHSERRHVHIGFRVNLTPTWSHSETTPFIFRPNVSPLVSMKYGVLCGLRSPHPILCGW